MNEKIKTKSKNFLNNIAWWVLLAAFALTITLMLIPREQVEIDPNILPWNSHFNEQGNLNVLGLTLNESTPNDAVKLFGVDYETLAFSKKDLSGKVVEIYFPTMRVARLRAVATLVLDVPEKELEEMYLRGASTTVTKVGNRQVELLSEDTASLMDNKIKYLTLVPKKSLPEEVLRKLFGEPERIKSIENGIELWFYPQKGLEIIVNPKGAEILQYYIDPSVRKH